MNWVDEQYQNLRKDYELDALDETTCENNPFSQFEKWLEKAIESGVSEPTAMSLSTVENFKPHCRIVLLKAFDDLKLYFFTNYNSNKGLQLKTNPNAAILFFWPTLQRQIRIEGLIEKTSSAISDKYFLSRPIDNQIAAIVSCQSKLIKDRSEIEEKYQNLTKQIQQTPFVLSRPDNWGGYSLTPVYFEFWQGRKSRLHDRIVYQLVEKSWNINRIAP